MKNRRHYFEKYATSNKFDPLNPEEWYKQTPEKLMQKVIITLFVLLY